MVKNPPANAGDNSLMPGSERSPGEENGNPLQYSCLKNRTDRGAWWATVQFSSVAQSCPTLCDPIDCSMSGFPVHHQLSQLVQIHILSDTTERLNWTELNWDRSLYLYIYRYIYLSGKKKSLFPKWRLSIQQPSLENGQINHLDLMVVLMLYRR